MKTHDPMTVVENLRNHLATHDRPLAFLFGAGTSYSVNLAPPASPNEKRPHKPIVPDIAGLTARCRDTTKKLGSAFAEAWTALEQECSQKGKQLNIENILSRVESKIDAIGDSESLVGLTKKDLEKVENTIRRTIAESVNIDEKVIPIELPHDDFAAWIKKITRTESLEIFTTNYDILFERAFEIAELPFFDGFSGGYMPFFYSDSLEHDGLLPSSNWVRLWKIHGSVNWKVIDLSGIRRVIRTVPTNTGEMIFPSHRKYDESRKQPYTALLDRLSQVLNQDHALLITCGYSFSDEHINALILSVLNTRHTANVISLQYENLSPTTQLVNLATHIKNLTVIGPNAGVIGGNWGTWRLLHPVNNQTYSFMDLAFDSNAAVPELNTVGEVPTEAESSTNADGDIRSGKMQLGDFVYFCKFLNTMERVGQGEL